LVDESLISSHYGTYKSLLLSFIYFSKMHVMIVVWSMEGATYTIIFD